MANAPAEKPRRCMGDFKMEVKLFIQNNMAHKMGNKKLKTFHNDSQKNLEECMDKVEEKAKLLDPSGALGIQVSCWIHTTNGYHFDDTPQ